MKQVHSLKIFTSEILEKRDRRQTVNNVNVSKKEGRGLFHIVVFGLLKSVYETSEKKINT